MAPGPGRPGFGLRPHPSLAWSGTGPLSASAQTPVLLPFQLPLPSEAPPLSEAGPAGSMSLEASGLMTAQFRGSVGYGLRW